MVVATQIKLSGRFMIIFNVLLKMCEIISLFDTHERFAAIKFVRKMMFTFLFIFFVMSMGNLGGESERYAPL